MLRDGKSGPKAAQSEVLIRLVLLDFLALIKGY